MSRPESIGLTGSEALPLMPDGWHGHDPDKCLTCDGRRHVSRKIVLLGPFCDRCSDRGYYICDGYLWRCPLEQNT